MVTKFLLLPRIRPSLLTRRMNETKRSGFFTSYLPIYSPIASSSDSCSHPHVHRVLRLLLVSQVPPPTRNSTSIRPLFSTPARTSQTHQTMASDTAKTLLKSLTASGQAYEAGDPDSRLKLLELCKELTAELESPGETFMRTNWAEVRSLSA